MLWGRGVCGQWGIFSVAFARVCVEQRVPVLLQGLPVGTMLVSLLSLGNVGHVPMFPVVPAQPSPPGSPGPTVPAEPPGTPGSACRDRSFPIYRPDEGKQ